MASDKDKKDIAALLHQTQRLIDGKSFKLWRNESYYSQKQCYNDLSRKVYVEILRLICSEWSRDKKPDQASVYGPIIKNLFRIKQNDLLFANIESFDQSDRSWIVSFRKRDTIKKLIKEGQRVPKLASSPPNPLHLPQSHVNIITPTNISSGNSSNDSSKRIDSITSTNNHSSIPNSTLGNTSTISISTNAHLANHLIKEVLTFIHDHFRFMLTKHGLGHPIQRKPARLSVHAILNARLMNEYKDVLLSPSLREKIWPVVQSGRHYNDIVPWLVSNKFPYPYNAESKKTANLYGIYRFPGGDVYDGEWKEGMMEGIGKCLYAEDQAVYEGEWKSNERFGKGTYVLPSCFVYEGEWKADMSNGQGKCVYDNGDIYEGQWKNNQRHGKGTYTWRSDGSVHIGNWKDGKPVIHLRY